MTGSVTATAPKKPSSAHSSTTAARRTVGRSRRRRPQAETPVETNFEEDKENTRQNYSRRKAHIGKTPIKSTKKSIRKNNDYEEYCSDDGFVSFDERKTLFHSSIDQLSQSQKKDIQTTCSRMFRQSLKKASVSSTLWDEVPKLADTLVRVSLSKSTTIDSLGFEDHVSMLLSLCRKLIKDVSADKKCEENNAASSFRDNLFVSVHILRSVTFVLAETATIEQKELLLKLFYHLIITTSDIGYKRKSDQDTTKLIILAGYEGLAHIFSSYTILQEIAEDKEKLISFELIHRISVEDSSKLRRLLFAVPSTSIRKSTKLKSAIGVMNVRQLCTIALKTTIAVAKVILHIDSSVCDSLELCGDLGFILAEDKRRQHFPEVGLELLEAVHTPWLNLLASTVRKEQEVMKEVLSFSKGVHRMLWDAASTLKSRHSKNETEVSTGLNQLEIDCLVLRKRAIMYLFPATKERKLLELIQKTSFESGCTYAWKAASVFFQQLLSTKSDTNNLFLRSFYTDLDTTFAKTSCSVDSDSICLGFVEYQAYRSLHFMSGPTPTESVFIRSFTDFDELNIHDNEIVGGDYKILHRILELAILSKSRIEGSIRDDLIEAESVVTSIHRRMGVVEKLMRTFRRLVVGQFDRIPSDVVNRVLKLFCNVSLHRTLFLWTKQKRMNNYSERVPETELLVASAILTECIGPFLCAFINQNPQKASQFLDLTTESFIRPLAIYESATLHQEECEENRFHLSWSKYSEYSKNLCKRILEVLIDYSERFNEMNISIHSLEKAAKSLFALSKERKERSLQQHSMLLLVSAIELYDRLDLLNGLQKDYQLSSRYFHLSTTYESLGQIEESFFASCMVLQFEARKSSTYVTQGQSVDYNLLNFLSSMTSNVLPPLSEEVVNLPQVIRSVCRQMARNLTRVNRWSSNLPDPPPSLSIHSIQKKIHPIDCIRSLLEFDVSIERGIRLVCLFSVIEILFQMGRILQEPRDSDDENTQLKLRNGMHNFSSLYNLVQSATMDLSQQFPCILSGILGIVASVSIMPCMRSRKNTATTRLECGANETFATFARKALQESVSRLDASSCKEGQKLLSKTLGVALQNLIATTHYDPLRNDCFENLLKESTRTAEILCAVELPISRATTYLTSIKWMMWTMTMIQNEFESSGDYTRALVVSSWILSLAEIIKPDHPWFHASVITVAASENHIPCLMCRGSIELANPVDVTESFTLWLFRKEYHLCRIRMDVFKLHSKRHEWLYYIQTLAEIQNELEEYLAESSGPHEILYMWVLSTVYLIQSDVSSMHGRYAEAFVSAQMCQRYCQELLRQSPSSAINPNEWISELAISTILARSSQRYIEILSRRTMLHYRLGDHRRAMAYMNSVLEYIGIDPDSLVLDDCHIIPLKDLNVPSVSAGPLRMYIRMKGWSSKQNDILQYISRSEPKDMLRKYSETTKLSIGHAIYDMITVGDVLYGESISTPFKENAEPFYQAAMELMARNHLLFEDQVYCIPEHIADATGIPMQNSVQLREVRKLRASSKLDENSKTLVSDNCHHIDRSDFSSSYDKAWALHYLGIIELEKARESGALRRIWDDNEYYHNMNDENLCAARIYFSKALNYLKDTSDIFVRATLRNLALAEGPGRTSCSWNSAGILILESIGQSLRRKLEYSFDRDNKSKGSKTRSRINNPFGIFCVSNHESSERESRITQFFNELASRTPDNWGFVAPVICSSGEMLVAIVTKSGLDDNEFVVSTRCIFPAEGEDAYDYVVKPIDDIIDRVQKQLHEVNPGAVSNSKNKETIKRQWWDDRIQLDEEMSNLLDRVESRYFSKIFNEKFLARSLGSVAYEDSLQEFPRGNLTSRFEAALDDTSLVSSNENDKAHDAKVEELKKLTIPKLKDRLLLVGVDKSQFRKLRKMDFIELLIQMEQELKEKDNEIETEQESKLDSRFRNGNACLFLLLDENLHRFPFEGMSSLRGKTVCRVPCLSFVLATLQDFDSDTEQTPFVDATRVSHVIDPENNLQATRERITSGIEKLTSSRNWNWKSVVGEIPPASFFKDNLRQVGNLLMYFGHGGAQVCFSRRKVDDLIDMRSSHESSCRATVLLMGCSSAKLESINRKNSDSIDQTPLYYEPEGVALSYLCAGAPCVVGNLWDVTDNDIDRFSISLLERFFGEAHSPETDRRRSLAESVSVSRSVCKLKYLVGCAPVCYGVPVCLRTVSGRSTE